MKIKIYISIVLLCAAFLVWGLIFAYDLDKNMKVYFLDVGQGDAAFIETPEKVQVLIDGGPDNSLLSELSSVMPFYDREIDLVVFSHPQKDHIFGLIELLKRYKVDNIMFSSIDYQNSFYDEIKKIIEEKKINKIEAKAGEHINLGETAFLNVLYPFKDVANLSVQNPNDFSMAVVLNFLGKKFLFAGDAELKEELELANSGLDIDVDVLKINHHGSKTSSSEIFLEKTTPEIAVISVGKNNPYHHPSDIVLERLKEIKLFRTDINGRVKITTDGSELNFKTQY